MAITASASASQPQPLRWTKEEYHRMGEMGLFEGRRVELIEGEIIEMAPMTSPHWTSCVLVHEVLSAIFQEGYLVVEQLPISLSDESEPEPDVAVIRGQARDFKDALPSNAVLVIEVSFTTLQNDLGRKANLYARAGIEEYWVLDIEGRRLWVHREPQDGQYTNVQMLRSTKTIAPLAAPDASIAIADLLP